MSRQSFDTSHHIARWRQRVRSITRHARTDAQFSTAWHQQRSIDPSRLAALGWRALHEGDQREAQTYFRAALHHDPYTVSAWIGLSRAVHTRVERRQYLQAALDLHLLLHYADQAPAVRSTLYALGRH